MPESTNLSRPQGPPTPPPPRPRTLRFLFNATLIAKMADEVNLSDPVNSVRELAAILELSTADGPNGPAKTAEMLAMALYTVALLRRELHRRPAPPF